MFGRALVTKNGFPRYPVDAARVRSWAKREWRDARDLHRDMVDALRVASRGLVAVREQIRRFLMQYSYNLRTCYLSEKNKLFAADERSVACHRTIQHLYSSPSLTPCETSRGASALCLSLAQP